jgi:cytochrome c oxidase assembly factor CtaG
MTYLPIHMVAHVLVMFLVPMGLIGSAWGRSMWWVLSSGPRRRLLRWWYVERKWRAPRGLVHPITATIVLNVVMVVSHMPRVFNAVMEHPWAMDWLMEPAFLLSGLFFFHFLVVGRPRTNHVRVRLQLVMVAVTMFEMLVLAMAMSIFTTSAWYQSMIVTTAMPGMASIVRSPEVAFHQQQLAAAILWICGDFWAVPVIVVAVRRLVVREGSLFAVLERQSESLSRSPS